MRIETVLLISFLTSTVVLGLEKGSANGDTSLNNNWLFHFAGADSNRALARSKTLPSCDTVSLPHTFPRRDSAGTPPAGIGWYFTNITVTSEMAGCDVFLEFDGVCLRAEIFVDGAIAGKSPFPYLQFRVDLTPFVQGKGSVRLAVRVDNRLRERELPDTRANGWRQYGGLVREVRLSVLPKKRIDRVALGTFYRGKDTFDLRVQLAPASVQWDSVVIGISPGNTAPTVRLASLTGTDTVVRCIGMRSWTPDTPRLYNVSLVPWFSGKPGDTLRLRRGFCQMTRRGSGLFLNGVPVYLRGMSRHDVMDDSHPLLGRQKRLKELLDLKNLNVNLLRIAHFPQSRDIYELCDSLGILVMDEIPAWKTDAAFLGSKEGWEYGAAYGEALIGAHGNYTSICLWSLGNQFAGYLPQVAEYVKKVAGRIRNIDSSRLVTYCSYYYMFDKGFPYVDVISLNEYFGWELGSLPMLSLMLDKIHKEWPDKPLFISEFGAQAAFGLRNPQPQLAGIFRSVLSKDLSEDHQALYLQSHIDTIWSRRSFVSGMAIWNYADYRCGLKKSRTDDMPAGLNAIGIVSEKRDRKLSYPIVQERYGMIRSTLEHERKKFR